MKKKKKVFILCICLAIVLLALSGCSDEVASVDVAGKHFQGANVVFMPFYAIWHWLWHTFTPGFWHLVSKVSALPGAIVWLAVPLAYGLGGLLFAAAIIVILFVELTLGHISVVFWLICLAVVAIFY